MERKAILCKGEIRNLSFEETRKQFENFLHFQCQKFLPLSDPRYDEALHIANIYLWRAWCGYDVALGFEFSTYAGKAIVWHIYRFLYPKKPDVPVAFSLDAEVEEGEKIRYGDLAVGQCDPGIETQAVIRETLCELDDRDRQLLLARLYGYDQREIKSMLDLKVRQPQVSRLLRRARERFKKLYIKKAAYAPT